MQEMPGIPGRRSDADDNELTTPVASLKEGLPVRDFLTQLSTEFEVKPDDNEEDKDGTAAESCFDFSDIEKVVNLDMIEVDIEDGEDGTPFDKYRRKMTSIVGDGKVMKHIVKHGVGPLVPENSLVYLRYQAYIEYQEVPFDSTLWQCSGEGDLPVPYNLAKGQLIPGLYEAILTMRKSEKAEILIHPDLAYGQIGCPPRIPPEATVLFIVEVDRFVDCGDVLDSREDLDIHERKEFRNVYRAAKGHYEAAKDLFTQNKYSAAASKYRLVINMMHNASLANEEEEKERNHFLIKNYTNACVCYKKLKNFKRICILAVDALRVDEKEVFKNSKLLYLWGYAKMILGDYAHAKNHLQKALRLRPKDVDISSALIELERRKTDALQQERLRAMRAFGGRPPTGRVEIKEVNEEEEELRKSVKGALQAFADDPNISSLDIKEQTLNTLEEKIYLEVAKELGLYARVVEGAKRIVHIKKPDDYYD